MMDDDESDRIEKQYNGVHINIHIHICIGICIQIVMLEKSVQFQFDFNDGAFVM
jgi:hypothetical protein